MKKKKYAVIVVLSVVFAIPFAIAAENPVSDRLHVALSDFSNRTDDPSYDTPCAQFSDTLFLTLRLLNSYEVKKTHTVPSAMDDATLQQWCAENNTDSLLYGEVRGGPNATQNYRLSVYGRAQQSTIISETYTGSSVFDVFSASDSLIGTVLSSLSGRHMGFGSLSFRNTGANGSWAAVLDGVVLGQQVGRIVGRAHGLDVPRL